MNTIFAIADLHFGHAKLAAVRGFDSPEQHDAALIKAWNATVTKRDVVYVLGDVFKLDLLGELRGTKKLALGNHDTKPCREYLKHFSQVRGCFEFDGCLLTHIPVHESQFRRWQLNVHGHTHARRLENPRYVCVSVEQTDAYTPFDLRQVIEARRRCILPLVGYPGP